MQRGRQQHQLDLVALLGVFSGAPAVDDGDGDGDSDGAGGAFLRRLLERTTEAVVAPVADADNV